MFYRQPPPRARTQTGGGCIRRGRKRREGASVPPPDGNPPTTPPPTTTTTELVDAEALAAFCDDLQNLFETMGAITGEPNIEPTTSVEVVKSYASDVADVYQDVASSAQDLDEAAFDQIA